MKIDFLIGSERSGSNLITKLIDNHSQYCGPTPPHLLRIFAPNLSKYGNLQDDTNWNNLVSDVVDFFNCKIGIWTIKIAKEEILKITNRDLTTIIEYIYEKEVKSHNKKNAFIKEINTYKFIPFIKKSFAQSKFIWLVRDPRDMALSWSKSPIHRGDIMRGANIWKENQKETLKTYENNKDFILKITYENLITDQITSLKEICRFLNIKFEKNMLDYHQQEMSSKNALQTDNWKNLNKKIMVNNKKKFLKQLSKNQIQFIEYLCKDEMIALDYELEYPLIDEEEFKSLSLKIENEERYEKEEYKLTPESEKIKRERWYKKYMEIENK